MNVDSRAYIDARNRLERAERDTAHEYIRRCYLLYGKKDWSGLESQLRAAMRQVISIEQRESDERTMPSRH